jgi:hypothetical protein
MSHDQRPGRVRVFSSGNPAETPQRRRSDPKPVPAVPDAHPDASPPASARSLVTRALLFLIACAAGGAIVSASGLLGMVGR